MIKSTFSLHKGNDKLKDLILRHCFSSNVNFATKELHFLFSALLLYKRLNILKVEKVCEAANQLRRKFVCQVGSKEKEREKAEEKEERKETIKVGQNK